MKAFIIVFLLCISVKGITEPLPVEEKIRKQFQLDFPHAREVIWSASAEGCGVYFIMKETKYRVWYDEYGNVTQTFRYLTQEQFSPFLVIKLHRRYPEKTIFGIIETCKDQEVHYVIILEDEKTICYISSDAYGNFVLDKKYPKK